MADINSTTNVTLQINGQQASQTIKALENQAKELRKAIDDASKIGDDKKVKDLNKELNNTKAALKTIQSTTKNVEDTMKNLDKASPRDLKDTLKVLQKQLNNIERGSSAWTAQTEKIKQVKAQLAQVNSELAVHESFVQRMNRKFNDWGASIMAAGASLAGLVAAGKKAVSMYAEMDQEMANVRKFTGMSAEEVEHMNEAFKQIDTRTSRDNLNKLAQEAGRLGKTSEEDVLGFVKAADKINVALDDLGEGATLTLSKLTNIFGDEARYGTEQSLLKVGSVINELSQNCTASAPYLAQFAQRLAGVGAQAGMTIPQIMGFGAVLDSQGQAVEMSASALSKLIMNLFKNADKICQATGMNVQKFKETAVRDTNEALIMLLERLHEMGNMDALAPLFQEMGENGVRSSQVLAALAGNIETVKAQQEAANVAFEEGISIDKEFNVQNTTVQANLEKARKGFQEMAVTLGKELMPIVSHLISGTSAAMRVMLKVVEFVKEYNGVLITLTATLIAYYAVAKAKDAWTAIVNGCKSAIQAFKAFNATLLANPYAAVAAAIVAIGTALTVYIAKRREAMNLDKQVASMAKSVQAEYAKEAAKIQALSTVVHNSNIAYTERKKALEELKSIVPDYHAELTQEGKLINDNKQALDNYLDSLRQSIRIKAANDKIESAMSSQLEMEPQLEALQKKYDDTKAKYDQAVLALQKAKEAGDKNAIRGLTNTINGTTGSYGTSLIEQMNTAETFLNNAKAEYQKYQDIIDKFSKQLPQSNGGNTGTSTGTSKTTSVTTNAPVVAEDTNLKNRFAKEEEWRAMEEAKARIAYARGESDYQTYTDTMQQITVDFYAKELEHTDLSEKERLEIEASYQEALKKQRDTANQGTIEAENQHYKEILATVEQSYADGKMSNTSYKQALELLELDHLKTMVNLTEEGSKERLKAEQAYQKRSIEYQRQHVAEAKKMQEELQKKYFKESGDDNSEEYKAYQQQLELLRQELLAKANTDSEKLRIEQEYQNARYMLAKEYNDKIEMNAIDAARATTDKVVDFLNSDAGKAITQSFSMIVSSMGQIFGGLTDIIEAEVQIETAEIEARYDAEIAKAGENEQLVAALEKKKQDEIAAVKEEASRKEFEMQVIQTVAQTALAAISAYSSAAAIPVVGWIMAPIAASLAVAAGAIQIAAMKKQQEAAAATGYASGGYTRPGSKYEPAGIVHAGEWVASQETLANPTAAAAIATIDEAQRTNTLGSLSRQDVSRSVAGTAMIASSTEGSQAAAAAQVATNARTAAVLGKLNQRLNEPFVTVNTASGDRGIKKAINLYDRMNKGGK